MNELVPGALLVHYKIVRRLGQGSVGVVYEAIDQKLGRHVAVKLIIHPQDDGARDSSNALERFWREARAASSLNQPFDGSSPHVLFNPAPETINGFDWSPSGKQLAVARFKSSSDVVLINDQAGNKKN